MTKSIEIKSEGLVPITMTLELPDFVGDEFIEPLKKEFGKAGKHFELYLLAALRELYEVEYKLWAAKVNEG